MRVLVAPDKFKDALGASEAAGAIAGGLERAAADLGLDLQVDRVPMADGGEGTVEAVLVAKGGERVTVEVAGPRGRRVEATYGLVEGGRVAVVEMAAASGLALLAAGERDPLETSTRGTGELLKDAAARGVERILLGIGGSATVDGGAGALAGLGWRFLDDGGREVDPTGGRLVDVARIESPDASPLEGVEVEILCDVENPLLGPEGAAPVYGPQKGATPEAVRTLEKGLERIAVLYFGRRVAELPGSGAAGGLGAGLAAAVGARLVPGFDALARLTGLAARVASSDLVLTGEGRLDGTSARGKVVGGLGQLARSAGRPLVALVGSLGEGHDACLAAGVRAYFTIQSGPGSLEEILGSTSEGLARTAGMVLRLFAPAL